MHRVYSRVPVEGNPVKLILCFRIVLKKCPELFYPNSKEIIILLLPLGTIFTKIFEDHMNGYIDVQLEALLGITIICLENYWYLETFRLQQSII